MKTANQIITAMMVGERPTGSLAEQLCALCADDLPVDGVGLALMTDAGHQGVIAATDGPARLMEDLQFTLGEGPCLDASRHRRPVLQPELARTASARWPAFGPAVLEAGIGAIFALPLQIGGIRLGILDLYRAAPGSLGAEELGNALAYGDAAVVILLHLQGAMAPDEGLHPQLGDLSQSRAEIHQATGVVAVQASVSLTDALLLLRAHAYTTSQPILEIAHEVLAGSLHFDLEDNNHE